MSDKSVLVLLSSYNGEKYIETQLNSILNQEGLERVDILVRDDGSSDKTCQIVEILAKKTRRVRLIQGENLGYVASFFALIHMAQGYHYYALSDQDDVWMSGKLSRAVDCLEDKKGKLALYGSTSFLVKDDLEPYGKTQSNLRGITLFNTVIQNFLPGHTQVFNNEMLQELQRPIDCSKIYVHDAWITNVAMIKGEIVFDDDSYTLYRQHESNELGAGVGRFHWVKERIHRLKKNDGQKYATQIEYLCQLYGENMSEQEIKEMTRFRNANKHIGSRFLYAVSSKLYRQKGFETVLFKVLYLCGGYKVKDR